MKDVCESVFPLVRLVFWRESSAACYCIVLQAMESNMCNMCAVRDMCVLAVESRDSSLGNFGCLLLLALKGNLLVNTQWDKKVCACLCADYTTLFDSKDQTRRKGLKACGDLCFLHFNAQCWHHLETVSRVYMCIHPSEGWCLDSSTLFPMLSKCLETSKCLSRTISLIEDSQVFVACLP